MAIKILDDMRDVMGQRYYLIRTESKATVNG